MTYKGRVKYKSAFGGCVSIFMIMFILSIFLYNIINLVKRNNTQIKKNSLVSASNPYTPPENLS